MVTCERTLTRDALVALLDDVASLEEHALVERVVQGVDEDGVEEARLLQPLALESAAELVVHVVEADLHQRVQVDVADAHDGLARVVRLRMRDGEQQQERRVQKPGLHF